MGLFRRHAQASTVALQIYRSCFFSRCRLPLQGRGTWGSIRCNNLAARARAGVPFVLASLSTRLFTKRTPTAISTAFSGNPLVLVLAIQQPLSLLLGGAPHGVPARTSRRAWSMEAKAEVDEALGASYTSFCTDAKKQYRREEAYLREEEYLCCWIPNYRLQQ